jgi:4-phospho-D-threonate 3-dehydrogenase / 4-phospho-D-erythronate 3-dehydrogenase
MHINIGITMGDPNGVGPEILLKSFSSGRLNPKGRYLIFGNREYLQKMIEHFRYPIRVSDLPLINLNNIPHGRFKFGVPTAWSGKASGDYIAEAVKYIKTGAINALVTLPINKVAFKMGGWGKKYPGHTEMLADLAGVDKFALMLARDHLRAVHVTQHIPLKSVPAHLSTQRIYDVILLARQGLQKMGIVHPKLVVCGLNPHAGDGGLFGDEDKKIIAPAVKKAKKFGVVVDGPISADIVWPLVLQKKYDAGIAMYHDQGQIPIKMAGFLLEKKATAVHGVNITLGLPFMRASVAHGTAYDIAGTGTASVESFIEAVNYVERL